MSLIWQRTCLHLQRSTSSLSRWRIMSWTKRSCKRILPTMLSLPLKACQDSLTSVRLLHRKPCFCWGVRVMWQSTQPNFTWLIKILMRLSWKRSRTTCSIQWILVSRTSRQGLPSRNFQSRTRPFLNWLSLKAIQQKTLPATRPSKGWPWKWMICSLSKTTSSQSGAYRRKQSSRFWTLTGLTTAVTRLLRQSWNTLISQLLNSKSNCRRLMTSILPCVRN